MRTAATLLMALTAIAVNASPIDERRVYLDSLDAVADTMVSINLPEGSCAQ